MREITQSRFKAKCRANGYKYVDWDAAFMEAIRGDWAELRTMEVKKVSSLKCSYDNNRSCYKDCKGCTSY